MPYHLLVGLHQFCNFNHLFISRSSISLRRWESRASWWECRTEGDWTSSPTSPECRWRNSCANSTQSLNPMKKVRTKMTALLVFWMYRLGDQQYIHSMLVNSFQWLFSALPAINQNPARMRQEIILAMLSTGFLGQTKPPPPLQHTPSIAETWSLPWMLPWTILLVSSGPNFEFPPISRDIVEKPPIHHHIWCKL